MPEMTLPTPQKTLRVGELLRYLKYLVEQDNLLAEVSVHGEVSSLSRSPSGHVYFTLKDQSGQLACVLFRREVSQQVEIVRDLHAGILVVVHGYLTVYEPRGSFQLYVERVLPQGEGAIFQRFTQLKEKLEREGLFAVERKRQLPPFPKKLALITSPRSQAYFDVLHRLRTQYPFVTVIEAGVSVQGTGAADEMVMAIDIVNRLTDADVILLVRGGGAPEELAAFNDERLTRAVFASRIPVITGVGHETDHTMVDFVADHRAATPSLAAAAAVPDLRALVQEAARLHAQLRQATQHHLRIDRRRWVEANRALLRGSPGNRVRVQRQRADQLAGAAERAMNQQLRVHRARLTALRAQLAVLDPLAILQRGYAVLLDPSTGRVISRTGQVTPGRRLAARVSDGVIRIRVEDA